MTGRKPRDCELYAMPDGGRLSPLIAAAPELLESLQQVIPILDEMEYWPPGTSDAIDVARAALAKARGEA
ncbi:hypothetical protein PIN31115_02057 [Pandoraea iniqua]|uniref:Uncharacterized protein n=2 Tax=Pandoraea iniqua TaxID=2508288 RepID=A0A5E4UJB5_9BURK|nr:hypothetical protein PIN31115_02057 [Pandoraea iniqua]